MLTLAVLAKSTFSCASDLPPAITKPNVPSISNPKYINNAVQIKMTPKGIKYFEDHLFSLVGDFGFSIEEGAFDLLTWNSDGTVTEDSLHIPEDQKQIIKTIRKLLKEWVGLSLKDSHPQIEIKNSNYSLQFQRMALVTDYHLLKQLGYNTGAVFALELEVNNLRIEAESLMISDLNNTFLKSFGLTKASLQQDPKTGIKIRLPFYVNVDPKGLITFKALGFEHNINELNLEAKYEKLVAPQIYIGIGDEKFYLNPDKLENEFNKTTPKIINYLKTELSRIASQQLTTLLNEKAQMYMNTSLEEIVAMEPVNGPKEALPFYRGMRIRGIEQSSTDKKLSSILLSTDVFIEDPQNQKPLNLRRNSIGTTAFNDIAESEYDVAIGLDRGIINRMIELSWDREYLKKSDLEDGKQITILSPPEIVFNRPAPYFTIRTKLKVPAGSVTGIKKLLFIQDEFEVDADIIAYVKADPKKSGHNIYLYSMDAESIKINEDNLKSMGHWSWIKTKVIAEVKNTILEQTNDWRLHPKPSGVLPLPPDILGISFDTKALYTDKNGHLIMYLNYRKPRFSSIRSLGE